MKYIRYTYVDYRTRQPITAGPAKNGPDVPHGIAPIFGIEQTFGPTHVLYGMAEDDYQPEEWMAEIDEASFYAIWQAELKWRADTRREQVLQGGIEVFGVYFKTDEQAQSRIGNLVLGLQVDPTITEIPQFKAASGWVTLTRDQVIEAGRAVFAHVQRCFDWCGSIHSRIDTELISPESGFQLTAEIEASS